MPPQETSSKPTAEEVLTFGSPPSSPSAPPPDLRLIHYNDVYHLDASSAEPVGGIARFMTVCKEYQEGDRFRDQPACITLFSGDAFNPSLESSVTKGSHMVPILNNLGTDCAAVGNHDLDFGVRQFRHLTGQCKFPWLIANVLDPALGDNVPIGNAKRTHIITSSNGIKIGIIGLGEREWLETINALPPGLIYRSATETARELIPRLRAEGAEMIVALTHMREPNDNKLAENLGGEIDLILGGHDHFYAHSFINGCHVLRSGTDFKQLSYLEARRAGTAGKWDFVIYRRDVVSSIAEHKPTLELADQLTARLKQSLEKPVGWTAAPLDARFTTVRLKESNIGNFVCDIMRHHYDADCALMAAGTIRGDQIYPPGPIRVKDITDCFPFEDPVVVIKVTGKAIREALENGVAMYPALEGRFPQVSNIKFAFDPSREVGSRVTVAEIGDGPIQEDRVYVLATRGYMGRGKDGYTSLLIKEEGGDAEVVVSEENGILISMMLRQYFMALKVLDRWHLLGPSMDRHWGRVISGVATSHPNMEPSSQRRDSVAVASPDTDDHGWENWTASRIRDRRSSVTPLKDDLEEFAPEVGEGDVQKVDNELRIMRKVFRKWCRIAKVHAVCGENLKEEEFTCGWTKAIAPRLEGRIQMVTA
ncbi:putative flagellar associated protein [Phaeoacremonium minimum UCRPA7]|uniref:Putative flagellar associated protein n=1 Tax=Phaeoacremonium minimum (strain UCR-PA7) TaxID=1286976 RepID=R8BJF2_PHAM7|nr:putative flagellar associated protein [Phaeoacremonium minimum UCRPA7]EON99409.1 putative flagellar associated protein [Phaeoacremonium minimum UCRPA7]